MADRAADLQTELAGLLAQARADAPRVRAHRSPAARAALCMAAGKPSDEARADGRRLPQPVRPRRAGGAHRSNACGRHGRRASSNVPRATRSRSRLTRVAHDVSPVAPGPAVVVLSSRERLRRLPAGNGGTLPRRRALVGLLASGCGCPLSLSLLDHAANGHRLLVGVGERRPLERRQLERRLPWVRRNLLVRLLNRHVVPPWHKASPFRPICPEAIVPGSDARGSLSLAFARR